MIDKIRDIKLTYLIGDIDFEIDKNKVKKFKKELKFISKNFPNDIISGSLALSLYGLIDREIKDIDIIIDNDRDVTNLNLLKNNEYFKSLENYLGYKYYNWRESIFSIKRNYKVDFFKGEGIIYYDLFFENTPLRVQSPISIIERKYNLGGFKNLEDIDYFFSKIF
jgi:hypothetical protein